MGGSIVMTVVKMVSKHARPCADKELEILQIATQNERDPLQYCMIRCVVSSLGCACSADPELSSVYAGTGGSSTVHRITTPENHPTKRLERAASSELPSLICCSQHISCTGRSQHFSLRPTPFGMACHVCMVCTLRWDCWGAASVTGGDAELGRRVAADICQADVPRGC